MKIHVLGVCGTFMGGIAVIAKQMGHEVTGSDKGCYPPMSTQLEEQGLKLYNGYNAQDLIDIKPDLVIIGNALGRGNEAVEYVINNKIPYISGPQWLSENVLQKKTVIGVAGTHGKTTTTSITAFVFEKCGLKPSFLVGGVCPDLETSARLTDGEHFIIEADEYDTAFFDKRSKFINYRPDYAILNNLEFDHADIFEDLNAIKKTFHHLVRTVPSNGLIVRPSHDKNLEDTIEMGCWTENETFGENADWSYKLLSSNCAKFEVIYKGETKGTVDWSQVGKHNLHNCLACLAVAHKAGIKIEDAITAVNQFGGVKRRMEIKGTVNGVTVYDDFAHHPTAMTTTIRGLKDSLTEGRVIGVWEPKSNTMIRGEHKEGIPGALANADLVVAYHNKDAVKWDVAQYVADSGVENYCYNEVDDLVAKAVELAQPNDHILIMTNGPFGGAHQKILDGLKVKYNA